VGAYFIETAFNEIASIKSCGGVHAVHFGYHRKLIKRFPFAVYYEVRDEIARVVAVLDMRRNPKTIRAILSRRRGQTQ
jgi:hypothetical protein